MGALVRFVVSCLLNPILPTGAKHSAEKEVATLQTDCDSIHIPNTYELFKYADLVIGVQGYKRAVDLLSKYESSYSDPMEKSMFNQVMTTYLSYSGDSKAAQKYEAQLSPKTQVEDFSCIRMALCT